MSIRSVLITALLGACVLAVAWFYMHSSSPGSAPLSHSAARSGGHAHPPNTQDGYSENSIDPATFSGTFAGSLSPAAGSMLPKIRGLDMRTRQPVSLSDYRGRWVLLEFMASW